MKMCTKYLRNVFRNGHLKTKGDGRITLYWISKRIKGGLPQNHVHSQGADWDVGNGFSSFYY
jgi:hypothetical protein